MALHYDPHGSAFRLDPFTPSHRPGLSELGAEEHDHRGVVNPDQHRCEGACGSERLPRLAMTQINAQDEFAGDEQQGGEDRTDPDVGPRFP